MNSVAYLPRSKRLLEQVSEVLRYKHYSLKTEQAYLNSGGGRYSKPVGCTR